MTEGNGRRLLGLLVLAGMTPLHGLEWEGLEGSVLLDGRIRYETAQQTGLDDSHALTGRLRFGYATARHNGLSVLAEGEATVPLDSGAYDAYPGAQGTAGKTVVADPENLELNRLQVDWRNAVAEVTAGRQRIIRNNARFIGNVGWRQNEQTYDAVAAGWKPVQGLSLFYGYLDKAVRIFGARADAAVQRAYEMESHAAEIQWEPLKGLKAGAYGYLLGMRNSPADSSDSWGAWVTGDRLIGDSRDWSLAWRAEAANQADNSRSPAGSQFDLTYLHLVGGLKKDGLGTLSIGFESLEGDGARGFSTPLATLHAFNGFADVFLSTPAGGLTDTYVQATAPLGTALTATAVWHAYQAEHDSTRYGDELDLVLVWKINTNLSATAKAAFYDGSSGAPGAASANVSRIWLQLDATY